MRATMLIILAIAVTTPASADAAAAKLLLRQVAIAPSPAEYIEIQNPNAFAVDLTDYYLADYDTYYQVVFSTAPGASDFVVRFPPGATIAAGATQTVALAGAECFKTACATFGTFTGFGFYPDYELPTASNGSATVPDMLAAFLGAIGSSRGLTNGNEPVVLFYWDGASNLVGDVDYVYYGTPTAGNPVVNKTGVMVNGSAYLPDTADDATHHAPVSAGGIVTGTCRKTLSEGTQKLSGGNGVTGSDETSEDCANTWIACEADPRPDTIFGDSFE